MNSHVDCDQVRPAFQLADDGLLLGIGQVVEAFAVEELWMRVNFILAGDSRLGGPRPIDLLREAGLRR